MFVLSGDSNTAPGAAGTTALTKRCCSCGEPRDWRTVSPERPREWRLDGYPGRGGGIHVTVNAYREP